MGTSVVDTNDFHHPEPDLLTKSSPHERLRRRGLYRIGNCRGHRLQRRIATQRGDDTGLSDRDADRGLGYLDGLAQIGGNANSPLTQSSLVFFGIFLIVGIGLGKLMRMALDEIIGPGAGIGDRLAGAVLGAGRVGLVAVTLVLVFDQLIPADRQPAFLNGSQLRPLLSAVGQKGFRSLPPEVAATIDRLKRDQRI
jgi:membrane protein required for colicin V production